MDLKRIAYIVSSLLSLLILNSCGGIKELIIPRAVSTANSISMGSLNLHKGDYEILNDITETASIRAIYSGTSLKIISGDGDFAYEFQLTKMGWMLKKFSGTANFGYLSNEVMGSNQLPAAEEFARRVAISKLIEVLKDYEGDGVLEPVVTTRAVNTGKRQVEYHATASAKIIKIHPTN